MKKGFTLLELVVSLSIFAILSTIAVGAYVSISRGKTYSATMRESQQKLRIAVETITRLGRQADRVDVDSTGEVITLYYYASIVPPRPNTPNRINQYTITATGALEYKECKPASITGDEAAMYCPVTGWTSPVDMLSAKTSLQPISGFTRDNTKLTPKITVNLVGKTTGATAAYTDSFTIVTDVSLENLQ